MYAYVDVRRESSVPWMAKKMCPQTYTVVAPGHRRLSSVACVNPHVVWRMRWMSMNWIEVPITCGMCMYAYANASTCPNSPSMSFITSSFGTRRRLRPIGKSAWSSLPTCACICTCICICICARSGRAPGAACSPRHHPLSWSAAVSVKTRMGKGGGRRSGPQMRAATQCGPSRMRRR